MADGNGGVFVRKWSSASTMPAEFFSNVETLTMSRAKEVFFAFLGTAKSAGQLAAAQSKKTKLTSIDLPSAFHELGKRILESGRFVEQFPSEHQQIKRLGEQIAGYSERTAAAGTEMKHKLKAGADNVKKAGLLKTAQIKRDSEIKSLGKNAFAAVLKDPEFADSVKRIQELQVKIAHLGSEIEKLAKNDGRRILAPKPFLLITGGVLGVLLIAFTWNAFRTGFNKDRSSLQNSPVSGADYSWNYKSGLFVGKKAKIEALAFSPDAKYLVAATKTDGLQIYDFSSEKLIRKITDEASRTYPKFSPDGRYLAYVDNSNSERALILLNANSFEEERRLPVCSPMVAKELDAINQRRFGNASKVLGLGQGIKVRENFDFSFSPDGRRIVIFNRDGIEDSEIVRRAIVYETRSGKQIAELSGWKVACFSHDGAVLGIGADISGDKRKFCNSIAFLDIATGKTIGRFTSANSPANITKVASSPIENVFAICVEDLHQDLVRTASGYKYHQIENSEQDEVVLFRYDTNSVQSRLRCFTRRSASTPFINSVCFSQDGRFLSVAGFHSMPLKKTNFSVPVSHIYDLLGRRVVTLTNNLSESSVSLLGSFGFGEFSEDGKIFVCKQDLNNEDLVHIWMRKDSNTGEMQFGDETLALVNDVQTEMAAMQSWMESGEYDSVVAEIEEADARYRSAMGIADPEDLKRLDMDPEFKRVRSGDLRFQPVANANSKDRAFQLMAVRVYAFLLSTPENLWDADSINAMMKSAAAGLGAMQNKDPEIREFWKEIPFEKTTSKIDGIERVTLRYGTVIFKFSSRKQIPHPVVDSVFINGHTYSTGERIVFR